MTLFARRWFLFMAVALSLGAPGCFFLLSGDADNSFQFGDDPGLPTLTFYTTGSATTPQLPFWSAIKKGEIQKFCNIRVEFWKNLDDLRALLLTGKGDLWLGHTEGFAQACAAGAPVQLLFISGWRKFFVVSTDPGMESMESFRGRELPYAPHGSPAVPVLRAVESGGRQAIHFKPYEPQQLALMLVSGRIDSALVPEPLVTSLLERVEGLRIVESVEDVYGRSTGQAPRMPIAGMAVNSRTAKKHPQVVEGMVRAVLQEASKLQGNPQAGVDALPDAFEVFMTKEKILESLERDMILVVPALEAREEILTYLSFLMGERVPEMTCILEARSLHGAATP